MGADHACVIRCPRFGAVCVDANRNQTTRDTTLVELGIRRSVGIAAFFVVGDGLLALLQPSRHENLWRPNVSAVDARVHPFVRRSPLPVSAYLQRYTLIT